MDNLLSNQCSTDPSKNLDGPDACWNYVDCTDPSKGKVGVQDGAPFVAPCDPSHSVGGTAMEMYCKSPVTPQDTPTSLGFVSENGAVCGTSSVQSFSAGVVTGMETLVKEFAVFDRFFCSVPGPTEVNRMYMHSGTSHGATTNDDLKLVEGYPQRTFYMDLDEDKKSWHVYYQDFPGALIMSDMRTVKHLERLKDWDHFLSDAKAGKLPNYSFIEPQYYVSEKSLAHDMHPNHPVELGDQLIVDIYNAVRNGPQWNETLFIVTYDEHGGFHDHVLPPHVGIPNPDGIQGTPNTWVNFERLGVRIPTLAISPWIPKGLVVKGAQAYPDFAPNSTSEFELTSILKTTRSILGMDAPPLTKREAWAPDFSWILSEKAPRTDCPTTVTPAQSDGKYDLEEFKNRKPSDLQCMWAKDIAIMRGLDFECDSFETAFELGLFVRKHTEEFIKLGH